MIPLVKHTFYKEYETKKALSEFLMSTDKFSMGEQCFKFEKEFSKKQNTKDAVLFNSGGSANLALLQALKNIGKLKEGDRIAYSSLTWSTNVMPIIQLGMQPIAVDIEIDTLNVMSRNLKQIILKEKPIAFFATNVLGFAGDLDKIKELCEQENIIFIEDNCESLGTELDGVKTGNFGAASTCSFFVAHHLSTIEGGMVCTDNEELASMLRMVRANGWDRNLHYTQQKEIREKFNVDSEFYAKYTFYDLGYNLRPTEITGFIGNYQLRFLDEIVDKREKNYLAIEEVIKNNDELVCIRHNHISKLSSFAFTIVCKNKELFNKYYRDFSGAGVEIRPIISGNMLRQPFYSKYVRNIDYLPNINFVHENGLYCGNFPEMTEYELDILKSCVTR